MTPDKMMEEIKKRAEKVKDERIKKGKAVPVPNDDHKKQK